MYVKLFWALVVLIVVLIILGVTTDKADLYIGIAFVIATIVDAVLFVYIWDKGTWGND
ncbi:MAG: hypothetical protein Q8Q05_01890 [bacterium]|nr:hypothetical protein [bacterium]